MMIPHFTARARGRPPRLSSGLPEMVNLPMSDADGLACDLAPATNRRLSGRPARSEHALGDHVLRLLFSDGAVGDVVLSAEQWAPAPGWTRGRKAAADAGAMTP